MTKSLAPRDRPVPRVALTVDEAAIAIGMSARFFETQVLPHLRVMRLGSGTRRKTYISLPELEGWVERRSALWLDGPSLA
jgi:hypothetical protein